MQRTWDPHRSEDPVESMSSPGFDHNGLEAQNRGAQLNGRPGSPPTASLNVPMSIVGGSSNNAMRSTTTPAT
jgi:hypothetical protein